MTQTINLPSSWLFALNGSDAQKVDEPNKFNEWKHANKGLIFVEHGNQFYGWNPLIHSDCWQYPCIFS